MTMCAAENIVRHIKINFKGKQRIKFLSCGCCFIINDKREKIEKIKMKEQFDECRKR